MDAKMPSQDSILKEKSTNAKQLKLSIFIHNISKYPRTKMSDCRESLPSRAGFSRICHRLAGKQQSHAFSHKSASKHGRFRSAQARSPARQASISAHPLERACNRQWSEAYDLCHTFRTAVRASHANRIACHTGRGLWAHAARGKVCRVGPLPGGGHQPGHKPVKTGKSRAGKHRRKGGRRGERARGAYPRAHRV